MLINENNERFIAAFPEGGNTAFEYGHQLKAHAVYFLQYPLLPYKRVEEYLCNQLGIPISAGSIAHFNQKASELIVTFGIDRAIRQNLSESPFIHADETGMTKRTSFPVLPALCAMASFRIITLIANIHFVMPFIGAN